MHEHEAEAQADQAGQGLLFVPCPDEGAVHRGVVFVGGGGETASACDGASTTGAGVSRKRDDAVQSPGNDMRACSNETAE